MSPVETHVASPDRLRETAEVRILKLRPVKVAVGGELLPADGAVDPVVEHDDGERYLLAHRREQLEP